MTGRQIKKNYHALLKMPQWFAFREKALSHYGGECWICADTRELHVHHMIYRELLPWEYDLCEVRIYCRVCHGAVSLVADDIWVTAQRFLPHELEIILKCMKNTDNDFVKILRRSYD